MSVNQELQKRLNYQFRDESLLRTALSHRSSGRNNNELMEFLGDSIIGFLVADKLLKDLPKAREGDLSRYRSELVRKETLAEIARKLELGPHLILGTGERKGGGSRRDSILSDAVEAIIAAIYLDSDITVCRNVVLPWFESRFKNLSSVDAKDPKTRLQEYLQSQKLPLPEYHLISTEGEDHDQTFHVSCITAAFKGEIKGTGGSKREAEQQAAESMLAEIESNRP